MECLGVASDGADRDEKNVSFSHLSVWPREAIEETWELVRTIVRTDGQTVAGYLGDYVWRHRAISALRWNMMDYIFEGRPAP